MMWRGYPGYKDSGVDWLGEIPEQWDISRVKYLGWFQYGKSLSEDDRQEGSVPVYGSNGIVGTHSSSLTQAPSIIVGRKGSFGKINYSQVACFPIDTTYFVDSSSATAHIKWLCYALGLLELDKLSRDSAVPGLNRELAHNQMLPMCTYDEQRAIVAFLDRETANIDALIEKKQRLIQLLQEKRATLIFHAVTKGTDPNAPMMDSGIPWLGEISEHWRILPLRRVVTKFVDYRGRTPEKVEEGIPLITARNIRDGGLDFSESQEYIREEDYESWMVRGWPEEGDVLVTTEAPLGGAAQIEETFVALAQRLILLKANKNFINNNYLLYHFLSSSGQGELWSRATGSTAVGIKAWRFKETLVTVPPLLEQMAISNFIAEEIERIEKPVKSTKESIKILHEYRTALISTAVTGKIDVRGEAA